MKFKGHIDINQTIEIVTQLFADPNSKKEYQDDFIRAELLSGEEGKEGAHSKLFYKDQNREMILEETIIKNNLPTSFEAFYHHEHMDNTMKCRFIALGKNQTRYETEVEYTRMNWIIPKLMAILFPSIYKKQARKWMENFKAYAERQ